MLTNYINAYLDQYGSAGVHKVLAIVSLTPTLYKIKYTLDDMVCTHTIDYADFHSYMVNHQPHIHADAIYNIWSNKWSVKAINAAILNINNALKELENG